MVDTGHALYLAFQQTGLALSVQSYKRKSMKNSNGKSNQK
jgi:hypothetical protein